MKIVFLSPYPVNYLLSELSDLQDNKTEHSVTWVVNLARAIVQFYPEIELHVITESVRTFKTVVVQRQNIFIHIVRSGSAVPFTKQGFPSKFPLDVCSFFILNHYRLLKEIKRIDPDLVHAHGTELSYGITAAISNYPSIISLQGIINELIKNSRNFRYFIVAKLEKYTLKRGMYFIAKTSFARKFIQSINPNAKVFDIENPMHESFFSVKRNCKINRCILFVGSIIKEKGIEELIQAISYLHDVKLKIIGNGKLFYINYLKNMVCSLGIFDNVEWLGHKTSEEIAVEFESAAMLALPSYMENSPNVVSEAMCAGVPVVATSVGGIPDIVIHEKTGLLVKSQNIHQLADAMQNILENHGKARKMGLAARKEGIRRFSPKTAAEKTINAYRHVLEQ